MQIGATAVSWFPLALYMIEEPSLETDKFRTISLYLPTDNYQVTKVLCMQHLHCSSQVQSNTFLKTMLQRSMYFAPMLERAIKISLNSLQLSGALLNSTVELAGNNWIKTTPMSGICLVRMVELTTCDSNQLIPSIAIKIEAPQKAKLIHLNYYFLLGWNVWHALVGRGEGRS